MIHDTGINCRLPQTPRTPSTAANHYFDDIFSKPVKPSKASRPRHRRSSTHRSIGNRSSFSASINGDEDARSVGNSAIGDEEHTREKEEANQHVVNYVTDQLQHIRSHDSTTVNEDEFETQLDDQ